MIIMTENDDETFFNSKPLSILYLFVVIGGPSSKDLAKKIAVKLNSKYLDSDLKIFPDGESKLTITKPFEGTAIIVQSTYPPVDSNLVRLLTLIFKAKKTSDKVIAVIPYLGYMRQDIEFLSGEIVTSCVVANLLKAAGADLVITVDVHSKLALNYFDVPTKNISAIPKLADYFKRLKLKDPIVISPDLFWANKAKEFAKIIGADSIALNKQRDRKTGKIRIANPKKINLDGRDVVLIDDMASTGQSLAKAAQYAKKQNCRRILAALTHPLLVGNWQKLLKKAGVTKIISTNTIPHKTNAVDVSEIIARFIARNVYLSKTKLCSITGISFIVCIIMSAFLPTPIGTIS